MRTSSTLLCSCLLGICDHLALAGALLRCCDVYDRSQLFSQPSNFQARLLQLLRETRKRGTRSSFCSFGVLVCLCFCALHSGVLKCHMVKFQGLFQPFRKPTLGLVGSLITELRPVMKEPGVRRQTFFLMPCCDRVHMRSSFLRR